MTENFPVEKFYVSHFTDINRIRSIIKSRALQPAGMQKKYVGRYRENAERSGDLKKYDNSVFYSIVFPDNNGVPIFTSPFEGYAYLIFSPQIIEDNAKMIGRRGVSELPVFCKAWNYGKIREDYCHHYDKEISLEDNLNNWRQVMSRHIEQYMKDPKTEKLTSQEGGTLNTELLLEGEMPIDMDLITIYIPKFEYKPRPKLSEAFYEKYPSFRGSEERQKKIYETNEIVIENLIKEHPDLPWTRENPFK
jgi:hypothetical protein